MLSFKNVKEQEQLSIQQKIERIGEMEIYFKYLHYFPQQNKHYSSPFSSDSTHSFSFRLVDKLIWKCFSTGKGGDCISLVAELHHESYKDAVKRILNDFEANNNVQSRKKVLASDRFTKYDTKIQVVLQDFFKTDLDYWLQGGITKATLDFFDIKCVKEVWLDKGEGFKFLWSYKKENPIFRYLINTRYKIYRPLEKDKQWKWLSTTKIQDWQGFKQLPRTGDILIITKSMKDVMVWYEFGYSAVSPCSESQQITKEVIDYFFTRFKRIYINYDYDIPGMTQMIYLKLEYGLPVIITSDVSNKDSFDLIKAKGFEYSKEFLTKQINEKNR